MGEIEKLVVDGVSVLRGYCFPMAAGGLSVVKVRRGGMICHVILCFFLLLDSELIKG